MRNKKRAWSSQNLYRAQPGHAAAAASGRLRKCLTQCGCRSWKSSRRAPTSRQTFKSAMTPKSAACVHGCAQTEDNADQVAPDPECKHRNKTTQPFRTKTSTPTRAWTSIATTLKKKEKMTKKSLQASGSATAPPTMARRRRAPMLERTKTRFFQKKKNGEGENPASGGVCLNSDRRGRARYNVREMVQSTKQKKQPPLTRWFPDKGALRKAGPQRQPRPQYALSMCSTMAPRWLLGRGAGTDVARSIEHRICAGCRACGTSRW